MSPDTVNAPGYAVTSCLEPLLQDVKNHLLSGPSHVPPLGSWKPTGTLEIDLLQSGPSPHILGFTPVSYARVVGTVKM